MLALFGGLGLSTRLFSDPWENSISFLDLMVLADQPSLCLEHPLRLMRACRICRVTRHVAQRSVESTV